MFLKNNKFNFIPSMFTGGVVAVGIIILLWILGITGYILNIVWLFDHGSLAHITMILVLRVVGIFVPPVGALAGWFA